MKIKPLTHQKKIIEQMEKIDHLGLVWPMGTGKTYPIIHLLEQAYITNKEVQPSLVVCPSTIIYVWLEEILKFTDIPKTKIGVLTGTLTQRIKVLDKKCPINIINYEGLRVLKTILPMMSFNIVCLDEAHRIKNHKILQSNIAVSLKAKQRFLLTGTPILNSYLDIWNLAFFLDRGATFGRSFYVFRNIYFQDKNIGRHRGHFPDWQLLSFRKTALLTKMKRLFDRIDKKEVLKDLPEKIYIKKYCYLTKINKRHYESMKRKNITFFDDKAVVGQIALTKMLRLNQITSGFIKNVDGEEVNLYHNPKLELLKEVVEEIIQSNKTNKIIIWALFRMDIENIINVLVRMKLKYVMIMGVTKPEARKEEVAIFQTDPAIRIFIGQVATASEGITLTKANYAIYYSMDYSLKNRLQSEDRSHRKGSEQFETVTYIDLVMKDTVDEVILKKVDSKVNRLDEAMRYLKNTTIKYQYISGGV